MTRRVKRLADAPLLAWGDQLRAERHRRKKLSRNVAILALAIAILGSNMLFPPVPRLVWNASDSAPLGLYLVSPSAPIDVGDMVIAQVPQPWRALAARRGYLPANVPLVKRVAAGPGDEVCARGLDILINGRKVASRFERDGMGRIMPAWHGCLRLHAHRYFLLMGGSARSFDGRYFGITDDRLLLGEARLLWAR